MAFSTPPRGVRPGDHLLVVHDFDARGNDELTLRRGEKIELVELDDGFGDGWFLGKEVKTNVTGLFPGVYTTVVPKIPMRPSTAASSEPSESSASLHEETDHNNAPTQEPESVALPKSGDVTPQASRHVRASDIEVADMMQQSTPRLPSPKRSSSSPLPAAPHLEVQNSLRQSIDHHLNGQDSPVMNETLSVIDEHITDLSTPRHSVTTQEPRHMNDSASEYSSHLDHRMSYINGHETDEEEENQPTEEEVRNWNHTDTAKQLRDLGIESKHCDIFEEQEITGDVVLDMDQDFLFMKEFDFGVMGRRLKTWHKIKAFQEEVKRLKEPPPRASTSFSNPTEDRSFSRASHNGSFLPRIPGLSDTLGNYHRSSAQPSQHPRLMTSAMQSNGSSPHTPTFNTDSPRRPSAASIRDINHSRRHSSIDTTNRVSAMSDSPHGFHQKKPSFDRGWTMSGGAPRQPARPGTSLGAHHNELFLPQHVFRGPEGSDSAISVTDRYDDLDRGYFSGPEGDLRKNKRLQKRNSTTGNTIHSRNSSYNEDQLKYNVNRRHSRIASIDSIRDAARHASSAATKTFPPPPAHKSRFRSLSTRITERSASRNQSSTSAEEKSSGSGFFASFAPLVGRSDKADPDSGRSSPMPLGIKNAGPKFRRAVGFRTISDAVLPTSGKGGDTSGSPVSPIKEIDPASTRTGSTTPSATSKSSERHSTDGSAKAAEGGISFPRARASMKTGVKSKKDTSAYTRGLEKKAPHEQMDGCEFSGWMKKRSSNLMTTWKPRLFVLRGRRLSYYYSEYDVEERGLIDITAHRVLRADHDPIIALHATITGANMASSSPAGSQNHDSPSEKKGSSESARPLKGESDRPFFFKLVPPKTTRTVQFTKPAIHYFQVDNVKQGRLWMAALMKATIDRDMDLPVESSNKQKTISLKQARLMNQRPPALMSTPVKHEEKKEEEEEEEKKEAEAEADTEVEAEAVAEITAEPAAEEERVSIQSAPVEGTDGLMIKGLNLDKASTPTDSVNEETPASNSNLETPSSTSNPLGELDTGPSSLLSEPLSESK